MKYSLIGQDDHKFTIKHPDGSEFHVAKSAISKEAHKRILKMADGGIVPDESSNGKEIPYDSLLAQEKTDNAPYAMPNSGIEVGEPQRAPGSLVASLESDTPVQVTPQQLPNVPASAELSAAQPAPGVTAPAGPQAAPGMLSKEALGPYAEGFQQTQKGIEGIAAAKSQEAKGADGIYKNNIAAQETLAKNYNDQRAGIEAENKQLFDNIQNGKIDPHRLWNSKSTGNKIMASIGLILGGIGAGMTKGPNQALEVMQKQIDQDIDAQKSNLGKQQGMLSMNMQRYNNINAAEAATRLRMNTMVQAQLAQAAAKSGDKMAQANAQLAIGQLKQQAIPVAQQLAMFHVQAQSLGGASGEGGLHVGQEPMALLSDPKYQGKRVVVGGKAFQANSEKEAEEMRTSNAKLEPITRMVKELGELGPSATIPGSDANQRAQAIRSRLAVAIPQAAGIGRLNETEIHLGLDQVKDPAKFNQLLNGRVKNDEFLKSFQQEHEEQLKNKLIGYKGMSKYKSFKPAGQQ